MPFLYGKPDIQSIERRDNTDNKVLKEIEVHHNTSKNHLSNVSVHLSNIKSNSDTTATKLSNIQTINDSKLSAIQNFLNKDHDQFHLKHHTTSNLIGNTSSDGTGTNNHMHIDGNGVSKSQVVNTVNIAPANSVNGHMSASQSFNTRILGSDDGGTTLFPIRCDGNGRLSVDINSGVATTTSNSFLGATNIGTLVIGKDSSNTSRTIQTDTDGKLVISNPSSSTSDATASNQTTIISNQSTQNSSLSSIDSKLTTNNNSLNSIESDIESTNGLLGTTNTSLSSIDSKLTTNNNSLNSIESDIESTNTKLTSIETDIENTNTILTSIQNSQIIKRDVTTISSTTLSGTSETSSVYIQNYKSLHWHFVNAVSSGSYNLTLEGSHDNSNFHSDVNFFSNKHQLLNATYRYYRVRNEDLSSFSFDKIEVTKLNL